MYHHQLGEQSALKGPDYWLKEDWIENGWVLSIEEGYPELKEPPFLPLHCYDRDLPIFSKTPLDPSCEYQPHSYCPEGYADRLFDGLVLGSGPIDLLEAAAAA